MQNPYVNDEATQPYTPVHESLPPAYPNREWASTPTTTPPTTTPPPTKRSSGGARIAAITMLLAVIFGALLFGAGWEFGRSSSSSTSASSTAVLQPGSGPVATIPPVSGNDPSAVREAVIAKVRPAVVEVKVTTGQGGGIGSGVIVDKRGYIVTNNHVVNGAQTINVVLYDGTQLSAQLTGTDATDDLAVIKINPPSNLTVVSIGDSSKLKVGQEVLAIGNPLGITQTVTNGIISALGRSVSEGQGGAIIPNAIQTDAPINPGNSGGALVDMQGNLVGIPTLTAIDPEFNTPASGVGFAIPSNRVESIVPQIIQTGQVTHTGRAALGVSVADVDPTLAAQDNLSVDHGALIVSLVPNGAAAQAGLQTGDVIVQINNQAVTDTASLGDALGTKNPGDTVSVKVYRGNQQLTINVKLGELQAQP